MVATASGFIAVRDRYAQEQCLQAGRIWQRAHLLATAHGLAARPCNEAVEMVDHERALGRPAFRAALLNEITADPTWQPTFVFYMGYPKLSAQRQPTPPGSSCNRLTAQIPHALLERGVSRGLPSIEQTPCR